MPRKHSYRAFTLVELLVVIGIISLLIAILLPSLTRAREQANATNCLSNQRQLGTALVLYSDEARGYLPTVFGGASLGNDPKWYARIVLGRFTSGGNVLRCPTHEPRDTDATGTTNAYNYQSTPKAPLVELSYLYNGGYDRTLAYRKLSSIRESFNVRAIIDVGNGALNNGSMNFENSGNFSAMFPFNRHRGDLNAAFFDGHAEEIQGAATNGATPEWTYNDYWVFGSNPSKYSMAWDPGYHLSKVLRK